MDQKNIILTEEEIFNLTNISLNKNECELNLKLSQNEASKIVAEERYYMNQLIEKYKIQNAQDYNLDLTRGILVKKEQTE